MNTQPYHEGELSAQQKVAEENIALRNGRMVSDKIMPGALKFLENQPFIIVSSQDDDQMIWTSVLSGQDGYVQVLNEHSIAIHPHLISSNLQDVFWQNIQEHPHIGMLFIELSTRRRFRVNGKVDFDGDTIIVTVLQAYPNCPKYIQNRHVSLGTKSVYSPEIVSGTTLDDRLISWIQQADTFFVGSSNQHGEMDASHRGGNPGFVKVVDQSTLQIPDYVGNSMYNTLGNFLVNPKAGLLFIGFMQHQTLQLSGSAEIIWKDENVLQETGGTGRFWTFSISEWTLLENVKNTDWHLVDYSPFNPSSDV